MPLAPCVLKVWVNLNCTDDPISALYCSLHSIYCCIVSIQSGRSNRCFNCSSVCDALFNYVNTNTEPEQLVGWMEWWYFNYQLALFLFTPQSSLDLISFQIFCSSERVKKDKVEQRIKGTIEVSLWSFTKVNGFPPARWTMERQIPSATFSTKKIIPFTCFCSEKHFFVSY